MIGRLRGALVARDDTRCVVECAGVGYEVTVSTHTAATLPAIGQEVILRVFTHAQENKIALYGFSGAPERSLFDLLITVKNVGPASAMGILSGAAGAAEIAQLIASEEIARLTKIRGVGKKTAELIVVELREKCELLLASWGAAGVEIRPAVVAPTAPAGRDPARPPILDDVASGLAQLGWRPPDVDKALASLDVAEDSTLESLLRQALRSMPR